MGRKAGMFSGSGKREFHAVPRAEFTHWSWQATRTGAAFPLVLRTRIVCAVILRAMAWSR
jgi:hypothetical protein